MTNNKRLPNIIIFVPDEMRGDTVSLGKKNNPIINTPNIDNLARDGAAFTRCFTVNPVCVPSRCCTFTGQYVHSNNHRSLYQLLQPHEENLFKFLKKKGYEVAWLGRNDLFDAKTINDSVSKRFTRRGLRRVNLKLNPFENDHPMRKSFYFGKRTQEQAKDTDYQVIERAIEYLNSNPAEPFCLYLALGFPHPPYTIEDPYFSMYDRSAIPAPIPPLLDDKPEFMRIIHQRYGLNKLNENDFREIIATYYGMISKVDFQFGQIINELKKHRLYENSAIFFFSDHGDYAGNYGLTEKWPNAFQDCLINIPLIVKIPGLKTTNKVFDQLIESIDIFPTIIEIAEVKTSYTHFGKSLIPLLNGEVKTHREVVFAEGGYNLREPQCFEIQIKDPNLPFAGIYYDKTNISIEIPSTVTRSSMIRTKEWKLVIRNGSKEELYDLKNDSSETKNLNDDDAFKEVKIQLKERMLRWYLNTSDNAHWRRKRLA